MEKKILLVDDNADFLDSTKDVLEEAGYTVMTSSSGENALTIAATHTFDLVLMDIKMPGIDGVETYMRLKEQDPETRVILLTAFSMSDRIQKAMEEGVLEILSKPLDMARFIKTVEDATEGGGSILLVDDDPELCDSFRDALEEKGYAVVDVLNGSRAVEMLRQQSFDFLLLDMNMPGMTALEVYREAKKMQPQLLAIIVTGYAETYSDLIGQAISESVYTCLKKPVDPKALIRLFGEVKWKKTRGITTKP